ncbi:hypothetical protein D3C80_1416270 [compost metagenome]
MRQKLCALFEHPVQAAIGLALDHLVFGCQVQMPQQFPDLHTVLRVGDFDVLAGQAWLQQRRLARQLAQGDTLGGAQRIGHRQVGVVQHVEQLDEERHFLRRATLNQGQDKLALLQADEVVGVFTARGDPLEIKQAAEPIRGEKGFQLGPSQGGEHRHG